MTFFPIIFSFSWNWGIVKFRNWLLTNSFHDSLLLFPDFISVLAHFSKSMVVKYLRLLLCLKIIFVFSSHPLTNLVTLSFLSLLILAHYLSSSSVRPVLLSSTLTASNAPSFVDETQLAQTSLELLLTDFLEEWQFHSSSKTIFICVPLRFV